MLTAIPSTAIDIYRMLPEGTRCEVIFNVLTMSPAPTWKHQLLSATLFSKLINFVNDNDLGQVVSAPVDVHFEDKLSVVQPDIIVVLNENLHKAKEDGFYGAPDLLIEILSPGNRTHDTKTKKSLYEKAGVKQYFIVDPTNKQVALFTIDNDGTYTETYRQQGILKSTLLGCELSF